ncbi:MAG: NUDIX domain-containing protein [Clostridiales bacterium]|nr:NUDIX domain-containing protein [Clostridiales bacterium]
MTATPDRLRHMTAVYLCQDDRILLLYRQGGRVVNNVWVGSAGGHFEPEELNDPRACVLRELNEELGLTEGQLDSLCLRYIVLRNTANEVRQNYFFFAQLKKGAEEGLMSDEGRLQWFALDELHALPMPLSARQAIDHYLSTGRYDEVLYGGVTREDTAVFVPMTVYANS